MSGASGAAGESLGVLWPGCRTSFARRQRGGVPPRYVIPTDPERSEGERRDLHFCRGEVQIPRLRRYAPSLGMTMICCGRSGRDDSD